MYDVIIRNGQSAQYLHLHDTVNRDEKIPTGTITEEINAISSFSFTIYPNNPCYDKLQPYTTLVEVYNTKKNRYDFKGRVLKVTPQMDNDGMVYRNVICESRLGYLFDSIQPYVAERYYEGTSSRNGLQQFIDLVLENHNAQVEEEKRIYRGVVTVDPFKTSDGVYKGLNYDKTLDVIKSKLIGSFGGEIDIREGADGKLYLDYVPQFGVTRSTTFELGKNIESQSRDIDPSKVITRLIPLGAKLTVTETDENGNETTKELEERLTIESINGGVKYIEDSIALAKYGVIYGVQVFDDVTVPSNLITKAEAWLIENNKVDISDTMSAVDLSLLGLEIDDIQIYDSYPVRNALLDIRDTLRVVKKTTNIIEVYGSTFQLGNQSKTMTDTVIDYESALQDLLNHESKTQTDIKNNNASIITYVENRASAIEKDEEHIKLVVEKEAVSKSVYDEFAQLVRTILNIDENGVAMIFQTINEQISTVDGKAQSNYNEIIKYIRYVDGTIVIGIENNPMTVTISNDRMSFKENGVEVAYMSNEKLYIGNAEIKAGGTLRLGIFEFVPRDDGSLSCVKVGG